MPKENVIGVDSGDLELRVQVGWGNHPAGFVQVSSVEQSQNPNAEYAMTLAGKPVDGWYVNLDRNGINRLIKVLRKARDQAYGRDE